MPPVGLAECLRSHTVLALDKRKKPPLRAAFLLCNSLNQGRLCAMGQREHGRGGSPPSVTLDPYCAAAPGNSTKAGCMIGCGSTP